MMSSQVVYMALFGGALIGLSATLLLLFSGRVAGISGIFANALGSEDSPWRLTFLAGLFTGGGLLRLWLPEAFENLAPRSALELIAAGLLVGFGTGLANGCTSGHGICGVSRFSLRSLVATAVFMIFGMLVATGFGQIRGGL